MEMEYLEDKNYCLKDLLSLLKNKDIRRFKDILEKDCCIDIDYYFDEPYYGTLLDISSQERGYHMFVDNLLQYGANPNIVNHIRKKAPLHMAVENYDLSTVKCLINVYKTDVNIIDAKGNTPLHLALKNVGTEILELLLKNKRVDVNLVNKKGKTPLLIALEDRNKDSVTLLLQNDELKFNPHDVKIEHLLNDVLPDWETVCKINSKPSPSATSNVFNLLHAGNNDEFISVIRERGKDKNFLDMNDGSHTFLQYSCEYGLIDVIKELLQLNVNVNTQTNTVSRTPLMIAAYKGYVDIVTMLIDCGKCSLDPISEETVLHCVVKGSSEAPGLGDNNDLRKDHHMCLSILLAVQKCKVYINYGDSKRNTALHLAAKQGDEIMILLLLKAGASINCFNILNEPAFNDINYKTMKEYLDSCIYPNDKFPQEETYEIILNYVGLKPVCKHCWLFDMESGNLSNKDHDSCMNCNNFETKCLLSLSEHNDLKYLLQHPLFTSFLHLKWYKIHKCFYINLLFYCCFFFTLTFYILKFYPEFNKINDGSASSPHLITVVWWILALLLFVLLLREIAQLFIAPLNYLICFENWLEIALIFVTFAILCFGRDSTFQYKVNLSAIGIMLSWSELVLLTGRMPILSTKLEMLKTVSRNFLAFLAWYSFLFLAFAISFYILFGKHECSDSSINCSNNTTEPSDDFFRNPGVSFFKTVIMLTGEFDASSIPFNERPGTSHVLFILFVFLIAIVLFNLLNGLAVSDIQAIKSNAELVAYISRVKLISFIETLVMDPMPLRNNTLDWDKVPCLNSNIITYFKSKLLSRYVNIFYNDCLSDTCEARIFPNLGNHMELNPVKSINNRKDSHFSVNYFKESNLIEMDYKIVHSIKKILTEKMIEKENKEIEKQKLENDQLLISVMKDCQENLKFLKDLFTECKKDIKIIKENMNYSE